MQLFRVTDKWGDEIVLEDEDWQRIVAKHPEVDGHLDQVRETLEDPDVVYEGRYADSKVFYGRDRIPENKPFGSCYVAVIVRYSGNQASIRTAYLPMNIAANLGQLLHIGDTP